MVSIIRYRFGSSLPSCRVKSFQVHPNGDFSIYRYQEARRTIEIILPRCQFRARMRNNQHKFFLDDKLYHDIFLRKLFTI